MDLQNKQPYKNKNFAEALKHALAGIKWIFVNERNFRFHLFAAVLVIILGVVLRVDLDQWGWLILAIFSVIAAECLNTVIEGLVDFINGPKFSIQVKTIKDVSAGLTLITAIFAIAIGLIVFVPAIIKFI